MDAHDASTRCVQNRPEGGFAQRPQPVIFLLIKNLTHSETTPTRRHASRLVHFHVSADNYPDTDLRLVLEATHAATE